MECKEMNESLFQYSVHHLQCAGGVFIQVENENEIVIKLYGQAGMPLTYKQRKRDRTSIYVRIVLLRDGERNGA